MKPTVFVRTVVLAGVFSALVGCSSSPQLTQTGFISDYSQMETIDEGAMRYISPRLREYGSYIVDPVQMRTDYGVLDDDQRAEVANYLRSSFQKVLSETGYRVTAEPGPGTARIRMAITNVQKSTWWLNLHPGTKLTGAGAGGASMEGEIIDSVTGEQLAAWARAGTGNQFELDTFSELDDVKDAIDTWAEHAETRLRELQQGE